MKLFLDYTRLKLWNNFEGVFRPFNQGVSERFFRAEKFQNEISETSSNFEFEIILSNAYLKKNFLLNKSKLWALT